MKYFCTNDERHGSCYHELQIGRWDGTHWRDGSLFIHDDVLTATGLGKLLTQCLPHYAYYGPTVITVAEWQNICQTAARQGGKLPAVIAEADIWLRQNLGTADEFMLLGI
ncbi:MAG: hypothetical protein IJE29_03035 [Firmicutes bacterium]|nr:hypothetical protein [Bacillota bacterium]MBQ3199902.1 hypothetical protein [Bacillota bacterium]